MISRVRFWFARRRTRRVNDGRPRAFSSKADLADAQQARVEQLHQEIRGLHQLAERMRDYPNGAPGVGLRRGERLLIAVTGVSLLEQRVAYRRGPLVSTEVDRGDVWVTTRAVRFLGTRKKVEWRFDSMRGELYDGPEGLFINVENRRSASGLAVQESDRLRLTAAVDWGRALHEELPVASVHERIRAAIAQMADEIAHPEEGLD